MKTLSRFLLVVFSVALLVSVYGMYASTTRTSVGHDTFYIMKWPWLHEVRQVSLFAVLIWCLIFVKREPLFVRFGLISLIIAFMIMMMPFHFHLP